MLVSNHVYAADCDFTTAPFDRRTSASRRVEVAITSPGGNWYWTAMALYNGDEGMPNRRPLNVTVRPRDRRVA